MMGASNSTKRVVIENSSGTGPVEISESVVRRLKGEPEPVPKKESLEPRTEKYQAHEKRIPQESSNKAKNIEEYYQKKFAELEKKNAAILKSTTAQFADAVQEVEKKFLNTTGPQVCPELQTKVFHCYQANPDHTLECSAIVKAFAACVEKARQNALLRKG